nr:HYD1 signature containing ADP-ribosyltransferase family protein [Rheinheimera sp. EpRS3]
MHMNGRAYDYNLGRFLSVDPIIQSPANSQSLNPYSYIMNNPLAGTDPTGYCAAATGTRIKSCGDMKVDLKIDGKVVGSTVVKDVNFKNGAEVNSAKAVGAGQIGQAIMDIGAQQNTATINGGNINGGENQKTDFQTLLKSGAFESPFGQAQQWVFDNFINPIPDIEDSINAAMNGDYTGALESMAGIVGKKVKGVGKIGESIADGVTDLTERVRHFTNNKGLEGIRESQVIKASDQNSVFTERARGKPGSPRDVEQRLGIGPGRGRNYVEFDASPSEFKVIKNPVTGATERVFNGNVDLPGRNATFIKR